MNTIQVTDADGRQRWAGDDIIGEFVTNITQHMSNGAIQQVQEFLARQPLHIRARFAERCASLAGAANETIVSSCHY